MYASQVVNSTSDPAFAVSAEGRILAWNPAAGRLLGHSAPAVVGKRCWTILKTKDIFGNDYCTQQCQLRSMAREGRPLHPCDLVFTDAMGAPVQARVSFVRTAVAGSTSWALVHLIGPATPELSRPTATRTATEDLTSCLTPREIEVLTLVADGHGTRRIAEDLSLSPTTVRNHVQRILRKLRVHSRLEAVALARRFGALS